MGTAGAWRGSAPKTWTIAVVAAVLGALVASGVAVVTGTFNAHTTVVQYPLRYGSPSTVASLRSPPDWPSIAQSLSPSVVAIHVSAASGELSGSGVVYSGSEGRSYVLTASQLLSQGGNVEVSFADGATARGHEMAIDPVTGLALLWVASDDQTFPVLGSVADLQPPEAVMALGARSTSGGAYLGTVISVDQQVVTTQSQALDGLIAVSIPGMPAAEAGGALVDQSGEVVGISVTVSPTDQNLQQQSFAVPIDAVTRVVAQLLHGQRPTHPWIGVTDASDVSSVTAQQIGISGGTQVGTIVPQSPASRIGIVPTDIVTAFDGQPVTNTGTLTHLLAGCWPGDTTTITYLHQGKRITASIRVADQPTSPVTSGS